ncbi:hypothetical protein KBTX_03584 [wastewater metagenome]|uniref:DUF5666 domain-containing protein n=2 Tax=unclassified sequences TaxID=12908 RepID=A0A5B8RF79_9ZZZZ|nr:hypothetical protein [Arhodomonas sp. KWT]QEA07236.1 hypothetical protein KBTEX_03584 [uncultured organism]
MRASRLAIAAAVVLGLSGGGMVSAQQNDGRPSIQREEGDAGSGHVVSGAISTLGEDHSSLVIGDVTAVIDDRTVLRNTRGELMSRKSLRKGMRVEMRFESLRGSRIRVKELQVKR